MKQIILLILTVACLATSCKNEKQVSSKTSTLEVYADSLFQASIDSSQIAGASILVFQKEKMLLKK